MEYTTNINSLHEYEEKIRGQSLTTINDHNEMKESFNVIHNSLSIMFEVSNNYHAADDNELIIQKLTVDTFNTISSSLKLALSGYYKTAYSKIRYIFETATLIDYFNSNPVDIKKWFNADKKTRRKFFDNVKLRIYLDERDGNKEEKRRKLYEMYCEYAAHPTSKGFLLLSENNNVSIGPFFKYNYLGSYLHDIGRESVYSASCFIAFFVNLSNQSNLILKQHHENILNWLENNYKV